MDWGSLLGGVATTGMALLALRQARDSRERKELRKEREDLRASNKAVARLTREVRELRERLEEDSVRINKLQAQLSMAVAVIRTYSRCSVVACPFRTDDKHWVLEDLKKWDV